MSSITLLTQRIFEPVGRRAFYIFSRNFPRVSARIRPDTASHVMSIFSIACSAIIWTIYLLVSDNAIVLADVTFCFTMTLGAILAFSYTGFYTISTWDEYDRIVFGITYPDQADDPEEIEEDDEDFEDC
jgi:hypothetical protein